MIINGDGGYGLLAYIGGLAAQTSWLGPKVGGHLAPFLYSSREPSELSQWLCSYDDSTINIVVVIIIIPCWIGPTNCQPTRLRTWSAEIRREEKHFSRAFDCWSYHVGTRRVNVTMQKLPSNCQSQFLKTDLWKLGLQFLNSEVSSVRFQQTDIRHFHQIPHTSTDAYHDLSLLHTFILVIAALEMKRLSSAICIK